MVINIVTNIENEFPTRKELVLITPRLFIREFALDDAEALYKIFSDPDVTKYVSWRPYITIGQAKSFILRVIGNQKRTPRTNYGLAVMLKTSKELIGYTSLQVNMANRSAEWGIFLKKEEWGNGLGTEVQSAMLNFGFEDLGLHRIWATCDPGNISSKRTMQKTGMKYEGYIRGNIWMPRNQTYRDSLLFSILNNECKK
ncbi:GNAT family N-acetyltransferase [Patescibacteria group bacterium]|nr:GNAT family N-acetyltransferase [Patescibacteria group bacterium]